MRSVDELLQELREHPDCIACVIWTRQSLTQVEGQSEPLNLTNEQLEAIKAHTFYSAMITQLTYDGHAFANSALMEIITEKDRELLIAELKERLANNTSLSHLIYLGNEYLVAAMVDLGIIHL